MTVHVVSVLFRCLWVPMQQPLVGSRVPSPGWKGGREAVWEAVRSGQSCRARAECCEAFEVFEKSPRSPRRLSGAQTVESRALSTGSIGPTLSSGCFLSSVDTWQFSSPKKCVGLLTVRVGGDGNHGMGWVEKVLCSQALTAFPSRDS
jgi:hypothetical protein